MDLALQSCMMTTMKVPLVRTLLGEPEIDAVVAVLRSGQLAAGPQVAAFEEAFAQAIGSRYAVAVNSGTAALHCALEAAGVGPGDEVVTTPFTFAATATPILMQRGRPVFVDVDERTFNADIAALSRAVTPHTKAVVAVDLFGLPIDPCGGDTLRDRSIAIVEDACQAVGARRDGVAAGALGDSGCFSFYATKNIMTGEGGMLVTDDERIAKSARRFRQHGQGERYEYLSLGYNYRMTDLAAAIGRAQLARLVEIQTARRRNAARYDRLLSNVAGITTPVVPAGVEHAYHQYSILVDGSQTPNGLDRDGLRTTLRERGIGTGVYYPTPLHRNPLFAGLGYTEGDFPVAERLAQRVLALPIHPLLTAEDIDVVAAAIAEALHEKR
jgi:perosamine synthetase